jgi:DNA (cytosine-5)-methyltransferase 1
MAAKLTVLSAFSGLGGLDLGLEAAGFESLGCIEHDAAARDSLALNREKWPLLKPFDVVELAKTIRPKDLGVQKRELCLLAGAPPCQPFSNAAQWSQSGRMGLSDPRAGCLDGFFLLIEKFLPKVVLIENVLGFVRGPQSANEKIQKTIAALNRRCGTRYEFSCSVVDSADFGVPQRRKRAILVAHREGRKFVMPAPSHRESPITAWEALGALSTESIAATTSTGNWLDLLPSIPEGSNYIWHTPRGGGLPIFGYRTRFWSFLLKLAKDRPAWTIAAQPGPYTGPFHWENRPLTIAEALRLQTLPPNWIVSGNRGDCVRQIGNATPALLGEILGRAIGSQFFGSTYSDAPTLAIQRCREMPPETVVAEPPCRFKKSAKHLPDHPGTGKGPSPRLEL